MLWFFFKATLFCYKIGFSFDLLRAPRLSSPHLESTLRFLQSRDFSGHFRLARGVDPRSCGADRWIGPVVLCIAISFREERSVISFRSAETFGRNSGLGSSAEEIVPSHVRHRQASRATVFVVHSRSHEVRFRILSGPAVLPQMELPPSSPFPPHRMCKKAMDCYGDETSHWNQR